MRFRWLIILLVLCSIAVSWPAAAYRTTICAPEGTRGGNSNTWDGGDPDGIGLEAPDGALGPPSAPIVSPDRGSAAVAGESTALRMLRVLLSTVDCLIR